MALSPSYYRFINSPEWRIIRQRALHRAGHQCERCQSFWHLDVHHLTYVRFGGNELPEDLQVLCRDCHCQIHGTENPRELGLTGPRLVRFILDDVLARIGSRHAV